MNSKTLGIEFMRTAQDRRCLTRSRRTRSKGSRATRDFRPCENNNLLLILVVALTCYVILASFGQAEEISPSRAEKQAQISAQIRNRQQRQPLVDHKEKELAITTKNSDEKHKIAATRVHSSTQLGKRQIEQDQSSVAIGQPESREVESESMAMQTSSLEGSGEHRQLSSTATTTTNKSNENSDKIQIIRLFAPEAVQNGTQNVTIDCMFKFDKKLDQRLTIKWFFNDEIEPIYQWIPELNKRVYSDKYEHFLDKSYQVTEDVDFMLQSYKWLLQSSGGLPTERGNNKDEQVDNNDNNSVDLSVNSATVSQDETKTRGPQQHHQSILSEDNNSNRKLLANRLSRLAKLGSENSRQLLASLRSSLLMQNEQFSRFRALRLIRPTIQLNGRFTCSISSLEGDDLQSTRLLVLEPAKRLDFSVSRLTNQTNLLNLTCSASQVFPRPTLSLFRHSPTNNRPQSSKSGHHHNNNNNNNHHQQEENLNDGPKRRQLEPLVVGVQTQLVLLNGGRSSNNFELDGSESSKAVSLDDESDLLNFATSSSDGSQHQLQYEITAWTLVDESTLRSEQASQFECLLTIDGAPNYEQRQLLALQKGWQKNSYESPALVLARNSTMVSVLGAFAALLCLLVALVSAGLIFKLLRKQPIKPNRAKVADSAQVVAVARGSLKSASSRAKRSDDDQDQLGRASEVSASSATSTTNASGSGAHHNLLLYASNNINKPGSDYNEFGLATGNEQQSSNRNSPAMHHKSDGVYRVPASLTGHLPKQISKSAAQFNMANRLVIGCGATRWPTDYEQHQYNGWDRLGQQQHSNDQASFYNPQANLVGIVLNDNQQQPIATVSSNHQQQATISVNGKQLYC